MTPASQLLSQVEALGVHVALSGSDRLILRPRSLIRPDLIERLRRHKGEILALLTVREVLAEGRKLTATELERKTRLEAGALYAALAELWDWYELDTDHEGHYWLVEPIVN